MAEKDPDFSSCKTPSASQVKETHREKKKFFFFKSFSSLSLSVCVSFRCLIMQTGSRRAERAMVYGFAHHNLKLHGFFSNSSVSLVLRPLGPSRASRRSSLHRLHQHHGLLGSSGSHFRT